MDMQALAIIEFMRTLAAWPLWAIFGAVLLTLIVVVALAKGSKTLANVVLAFLALGAIASAVLAYNGILFPGGGARASAGAADTSDMLRPSHPALACLDGLAGELVEAACERAIFSSPEMIAAAVSYTAAQLTTLSEAGARGNAESADTFVLRRAVEADRYGLAARVLETRNNCSLTRCEAFSYLSNSNNVARNLKEQTYQAIIARYASAWGGASRPPALAAAPPASAPPASAPNAALPSGPPSNVDFPSASSIPPVSIMNNEPGTGNASDPAPVKRAAAPVNPRKPPANASSPAAQSANAAAKPAPKPQTTRPAAPRQSPPVQIAPADQDDN